MDAWVYLFSKFSHEALLFEALALALGVFGYAVFYLIRKRKYGVAGKDVPSNIIKVYLAQLVADSEEMRIQLFGLLGKGEATARIMAGFQQQTTAPADYAGSGATAAGAAIPAQQFIVDPKQTEKLRELEQRLAEQANALDAVLGDKMKLEEELATARADSSSGSTDEEKKSAGPDRSGPMAERLKQLEAQLAEYAIIEDDLANLKRLQKENKTLKEQLAGGMPAASPSPAAAAAAKKPDVPKPDLSGPKDSNIATEAVADQHADDPNHPADFESLVDVVEKNLADASKSDNVEPNAAAPANEFNLEPAASVSERNSDEKSEEQLQADFEKMLNS